MINISIIIPTFQRKFFLKKKLIDCKKLQNLNIFNFEFVFVLEEKDILSYNIIKKFKLNNKKIVFNNTVYHFAFRTGLETANGEYVIFMGDDDYFISDKNKLDQLLRKIKKEIIEKKPEWIVFQGDYINQNGHSIRSIITKLKKILLRNYNSIFLSVANFIMTPSVIIKKKIVLEVNGFNPIYPFSQDYFCWYDVSKKYRPIVINDTLTKATFSKSTFSGSFDLQRWIKHFKYISKKENKFMNLAQLISTSYIIFHNFFFKVFIRKNIELDSNYKIFNIKKKKLKILHLTRFFEINKLGGIEQGILMMNKKANNYMVQNDIITTHKIYNKKSIFENMNVFYCKESFSISNNVFSLSFLKTLNIIKTNYDIFHIHYPWPFADLAALFFLSKKKIILTYHADIYKNFFLKKIYYIFFFFFSKKISLVNISTKKYYENSDCKKFFDLNKIYIQTPGYKIKKINKLNIRKSLKTFFLNKKKFIFFLGRHRHYKGIHFLKQLIKKNLKTDFLIYGDNVNLYFELKNYKNVEFFFNTNEDEKFEAFKNAYVHIFPSTNKAESFGLTLLEAQLSKCPSVVFNLNTGVNEIITNNFNGLVAKKKNITHFNACLKNILQNKQLRKSLSTNCYNVKLKYNLQNYNSYYKLLQNKFN